MKPVRRVFGETITLATSVAFATVKGAPPWANALLLHAPSSTLENISIGLAPRIKSVKFFDTSASAPQYTNYLTEATDRSTSAVTLNSMATGDFLYVGCAEPFRGLAINLTNLNDNASVMTVEYRKNDDTWANISVSDGTNDSGDTLKQDGLLTWTVPTNWQTTGVGDSGSTQEGLFWVRISVSSVLDSSVTVVDIFPMMGDSTNGYLLMRSNNDAAPHLYLPFDGGVFGGIEAKSASITSAMNVTWLSEAR